MPDVSKILEDKLRSLDVPVAIGLPSGQWAGPPESRVSLRFHELRDVAALALGRLGTVAEAIIEGRATLKGTMRDLMATIIKLLPSEQAHERPSLFARLLALVAAPLRHSRAQDARQISFHYDVSDDFYALWLDRRRIYSCAYYDAQTSTIERAQENKLDLICRKLRLQPGERFLDVGAGWGGLLLWAAEHYDVRATGITLSKNQYAHVQRLIADHGLANRVEIKFLDYRDLDDPGGFDKIASVGMFEHVGAANMASYFAKLYGLLRPGGILMNHGITSGGLDGAIVGGGLGDFIDRHIFPGGELLHLERVVRESSRAGLEVVDVENLRPHYARTLWAWSDALEGALPEAQKVLAHSHGEEKASKILGAYRLYLAGCALAFERGWVALHQILAIRPNVAGTSQELAPNASGYPFRRNYMYAKEGAPPAVQHGEGLVLA